MWRVKQTELPWEQIADLLRVGSYVRRPSWGDEQVTNQGWEPTEEDQAADDWQHVEKVEAA